MRKNKGITLIALIITIIILLILVGVSVNLLIKGDLFGSAEKAISGTNDKVAQEQTRVDELMGELDKVEKQQKEQEEAEKQKNLPGTRVTENTKYIRDGKTAWIPKGFTVSGIKSEQSINKGLVIYDIPEGTTVDWSNPDSVKTKYNQFVWITVEVKSTDTENSIESFKRSVWQDNARVTDNTQSSTSFPSSSSTWSDYTEPYSYDTTNNYDQTNGIADQITELTKSIYKYGGFYIGRYEAGSTTERTSSSSQTAKFVVQQDKYPYNYVTWGKSMSDVSEGAVYLCNNLYSKTNTNYGATSMLCSGASWDSMLDFIKDSSHSVTDSTTWGNYNNSETYIINRGKYAVYNTSNYTLGNFQDVGNEYSKEKSTSILLTTGATERNSSKNIYDVAGNCWEWTTESDSSRYRVFRGRRLHQLWFLRSSELPPQLQSDRQRQRRRVSPSTLCKAVSLQAIY